jgi:hypothetical protein
MATWWQDRLMHVLRGPDDRDGTDKLVVKIEDRRSHGGNTQQRLIHGDIEELLPDLRQPLPQLHRIDNRARREGLELARENALLHRRRQNLGCARQSPVLGGSRA